LKIKRVIFAVYDDLHHEYRGFKTAGSFSKAGCDVMVFGIRYDNVKLMGWDEIHNIRIRIVKNFPLGLNMILFWFRLFFMLMKNNCDLIYCHDIFPLFPVYLASKLKGLPYIYDAHEFWHGNSQVENRPITKYFWTTYEKLFIKPARSVITVSEPIARELERIYSIKEVGVFTNLPLKKNIPSDIEILHNSLGINKSKKIVLYQGHFLVNNGLDTVIKAFRQVNESAVLVLIGSGSEKEKLQDLCVELKLQDRIFFTGPFPHDELIKYTACAYLGLCLIRNFGKSYYYSTPNKMFEFIQAHIPQVSSDFPEMSRFVKGYEVGEVIDPENAELISGTINKLLEDVSGYRKYKTNCIRASEELVWENIESDMIRFCS